MDKAPEKGNKGDHRSAVGITNIHVDIICDHTEGIKLNPPPMVWILMIMVSRSICPCNWIFFGILLTGYVVQDTNVK